MKRIVCVICLLVLLLSACSYAEQTPTVPKGYGPYGVYQLTFSTKLLSNAFVGSDWSFTFSHNGEPIRSGHTVTESLGVFSFYSIDVEVREKDFIDDVGTGTLYAAIFDGGSGKVNVTVTETNGIFKGKTAVWQVSCEVKLVNSRGKILCCSFSLS